MSGILWGVILGVMLTLAVAIVAAMYAYRRFITLDRRTRQAERLAELGALTGRLAHEIKNPLSTVLLNLQLLREDLDPTSPASARIEARLDTVTREAGRLKETLDDFLRYAGRMEIRRQPTDLNTLLQDLVDFFMPQAQAGRVQLRLQPHDGPLQAAVDARLLKQALLNLMLNAVQAMPGGGELILSLSERGRYAVIDVIDTGPGIPPDEQERIFSAYYTTKKSGTGIGLSVARRIAEEHGGRLVLTSEPGKGSDFAVHLPLD
jgi:signal transduction histidine kinase